MTKVTLIYDSLICFSGIKKNKQLVCAFLFMQLISLKYIDWQNCHGLYDWQFKYTVLVETGCNHSVKKYGKHNYCLN